MSDMDWNKHLLDKINAQAATIAEQAAELEALRAVLGACRSTCTRIIEQDGGILGGVDFHALRKGIDAAMQAGKAPDTDKCRKCGGRMVKGTYLAQTFSGTPDFPGDRHAVTVSPSGPGRLESCLKCESCGWSVTT